VTEYTGLVLLPGEQTRWWRFADGAPVQSGTGLPERAENEAVAAVYPAAETTLFMGLGAGLPRAQAVAIGQRMAADSVLAAPEDLHFAAGAHIAIVDRHRFAAWLEELTAAGLAPAPIIPAQLVPPAMEQGFVRMAVAEETVLRSGDLAFLSDPAYDEVLIANQHVEQLSEEDEALQLARAVVAAEVDLRQGAFAPARSWGSTRRFAQICGVLVGLILLSTVLTPLMLAVRLQWSAAQINQTADDLARTVVAGEELEPQAALERRLTALRGPGLGFSPTAAALLDAVKSTKGSSLAALTFDAQGVAKATVQAPNEADLLAMADRIRAAGLEVNRGPTSVTNGARRTAFEVRVK
jgi:general secretion pathway protein L